MKKIHIKLLKVLEKQGINRYYNISNLLLKTSKDLNIPKV